ncbi:hypothetical protein F0562_029911 [Nyssa sinensis]|uniref:Aminotransferase class I/classII large domain-containing protein n=1 Tax=Nyssa sinensis TaxID=561372 RepID=A0A5J5AVB6_9ASTE|nr:hypothetical protein F0562_029911 [Nyssa sinensis]
MATAIEQPSVRLSKMAVSKTHGEDSPYFAGWKAYDENPYDESYNPSGIIQLGLAENQIRGGKVKFNPERVVITAGATAANELLTFILADPGDALLVPTPYYPGFDRDLRWRTGVNIVPVHCDSSNNFQVTPQALEAAYDNAEAMNIKVKEVLEARNFKDSERVHIVYSLSKDLGLPGFRVGTIYSYNDNVVTTARRMSSFTLISSQTQQLLASMLSNKEFTENYIKTNRERLRKRYQMIIDGLRNAGIACLRGNAGLFCWMDLSPLMENPTRESELALWNSIVHEVKLNISPGSSCHCSEPARGERSKGSHRLCALSPNGGCFRNAEKALFEELMASKLHQLKSKACQASQFVAKHGNAYYKELLEQNKQYIQNPPTVETCDNLSKQLFYTRLASIPGRYEAFHKELNYVKDMWKNKKDLTVENGATAALFGLECFAWFCAGEIVGRGFTFTGYYV